MCEAIAKNEMFPQKDTIKTHGQLYCGGEVTFPSELWDRVQAERYDLLDHPDLQAEGYFIRSVQDTEFFAFVGFPENATGKNKVPGIVLVHGGGGTAFAEWVHYWTRRGYAAIAMDTCGNMPTSTSTMLNDIHQESIRKHGPDNPDFADISSPIEEQWAYHAIAAVIAGNSFLRSFECVDTSKIAITGISYGAFLTCQAVAYDDRFCCGAAVYGSLNQSGKDTLWGAIMQGRKRVLWDNQEILAGNCTPMLYLNGNADAHFSVLATSKSYKDTRYSQMLLKNKFNHSHYHGSQQVPELEAFVDNICLGKPGLVQLVTQPTADEQAARVALPRGIEVCRVVGYYTADTMLNDKTVWRACDGRYEEGVASANLPEDSTYYYINVEDSRGLEITSCVIACK